MDTEIDAIYHNHTWDLVPCPCSKYVIGIRWIFKTKYVADGSVDKFKARLVAKGFAQRPSIYYGESVANLSNGCEIIIS